MLRAPGRLWIDVEEFEQQVTAAKGGSEVKAYEEARALYGGELLTEDRYEDWAVLPREHLQNTHHELLLKLGQPEKALQQLVLAEKQAPRMPLVHYTLAKAYREKTQRTEAIKAAQECVQLDPDFAEAHYLLGQLYQETNQPELARREMEVFQKIKRREP